MTLVLILIINPSQSCIKNIFLWHFKSLQWVCNRTPQHCGDFRDFRTEHSLKNISNIYNISKNTTMFTEILHQLLRA